jgi:hypothetical protein
MEIEKLEIARIVHTISNFSISHISFPNGNHLRGIVD